MNDSRLSLEVSADDRGALTCEGVTLESAFIETAVLRATVLVSRVDPSRSLLGAAPDCVVKFSDCQYALPRSESLKLATPRHYRKFEGAGEGIRDEMEARYQTDVRSVFSKTGTLPPSGIQSVTGHVIYGVDGCWIFCTSIRPPSAWQLERLQKQFGAECVTTIADPSVFAVELGAAFAAQTPWPDIDLRFLESLAARLRPRVMGRMVRVHHGAVCYSDEPRELVESFPLDHQAAVVPFIKRCMYAWQQEYRFSVSIDGQATGDEWFVPITAGLRRLTQPSY